MTWYYILRYVLSTHQLLIRYDVLPFSWTPVVSASCRVHILSVLPMFRLSRSYRAPCDLRAVELR